MAADPRRHEPSSEDGQHFACDRCGEHLTDDQIGESQDEALTPCEPCPVAWRIGPPRDFITITCKHPGHPEAPPLHVATAQIGQRRLACVGETPEQAEAMRRAAESQADAGADPWSEQREQLRAMGHDVDAPGFAERMRAAAEALLLNLSAEEFEGLIAQDLFRRTDPGTRWAMLTPAGLAEGLRRADAETFRLLDEKIAAIKEANPGPWTGPPPPAPLSVAEQVLQGWEHYERQRAAGEFDRPRTFVVSRETAERARRLLGPDVAQVPAPAPRVIRVHDAKLFFRGQEIATVREATITPRPPAGPRLYDTTGKGTISLTATWSSADPADRVVQLERPQPKRTPRRLGWREKRRAAGAKRRGRQ